MTLIRSTPLLSGTLIPGAIQIRITPVASGGNRQVDDLYSDPFARR